MESSSKPQIEKITSSENTNLRQVESLESFKITLPTSNTKIPTEIEKKHVYEVYDKIATHFSHTRYKPWPQVENFLKSLPENSLILDIGCGNGKYLQSNDKINIIGTDRSINLLKICRERILNSQLFSCDSLKLPIRNNCFDAAISIAVIHHFSNDNLRIQALKEIVRILKINGLFLIYVWAIEQQEKKFSQQDNFVPWHLQEKWENNCVVNTLENGPKIAKDDKINCVVYQRYYHVFKKGELENLIKNVDGVVIEKSYFDHANWCCVVRKVK